MTDYCIKSQFLLSDSSPSSTDPVEELGCYLFLVFLVLFGEEMVHT